MPSTGVSSFRSSGVGPKTGYAAEPQTRTICSGFPGAVSQQPAAAGSLWFTRQIFLLAAFAATQALTCRSGLFQLLYENDIVTRAMLKKLIAIITPVSLCLLIIMLNTTTPATAGPFGILAIFIFAYLSSLGLVTILIYLSSKAINRLSLLIMTRKPVEQLTLRRSYYYSSVLALAPIMIIGMQSVGQITFYELLLVLVFIVIGCLYITKRTH